MIVRICFGTNSHTFSSASKRLVTTSVFWALTAIAEETLLADQHVRVVVALVPREQTATEQVEREVDLTTDIVEELPA